jgi:hypothetical protein
MVIRPARAEDVPTLSALARRTWADAFGEPLGADEPAAELEETRSESYFTSALQRDTVLVAESDGELVGYVQFHGDAPGPTLARTSHLRGDVDELRATLGREDERRHGQSLSATKTSTT